jgi:hypothetical protein
MNVVRAVLRSTFFWAVFSVACALFITHLPVCEANVELCAWR